MLDFLKPITNAASGIGGYLADPTGMGGYRSGLSAQEAAQRQELEALRGRADQLGGEFTQTGQQIAGNYQPLASLAAQGANQIAGGDFTTQRQPYQFQGQVSDYLDPSIAYQQDQARQGIESSAAARGQLMSGAALKAITDRAQQIGQQGYGAAYNRMLDDRNFGAQQAQLGYQADLANQQQRYNQANQVAQLGLSGLAGQTQGLQYGTAGNVGARQSAYNQMVNPTAGLGDIRAGEMRGGFTKGLSDLAGDVVGDYLGNLF